MRIRQRFWSVLAIVALASPTTFAEDKPSTAIGGLSAGDVDVRRASAARIRLSDKAAQRAALPALIDRLMKDKDGQVRLAVLDTLIDLGPDATPAIPALLHTLRTDYGGQGKEESHQDYRSALALGRIGKPAVEGLRGLLKERKENVRAEAVMALGRIGPDAGEAVPDLIPLLGDKSERIRREAVISLGRLGPAAVGPLIAATGGADVGLRTRAIESLGYLPEADEKVRQAVIKSARDASPEVRAAAMRSLAKFKLTDEVLMPIAAENLRHTDERVRLAVVNLLVERPTLLTRMAAEFDTLLTAEGDGVARHAAYLLRKIGPESTPRLIEALARKGSRIEPIAEALAQIGRPAVSPLMKAVESENPRVRQGAALALGQIRPLAPGTVPKLTAGLKDPDLGVRDASLTAIGNLGPRAREAVPAVRALMRDGSAEIRLRVIEILARSAARDEGLVGDLATFLDDPDPRVQRRAIETIRPLGPMGRKALPAIIARLKSQDFEVRLAAAEFVGGHGPSAAEAVPALGALLGDPNPKLRTVAAQTLGKVGKPAQPELPRLTPLLMAEQAEVREAATSALGSLELEAEVIRPYLAKALRDEKPEVRRAATRAIGRLGPQGAIFLPDIILMAGDKENLRSVERLLRPFERRGPDARSLPELMKHLDHDKAPVRLLAIKFLALAGRAATEAIPAVERLREDPDAEVRKQAGAAIEKIKNGPAPGPKKAAGPDAAG